MALEQEILRKQCIKVNCLLGALRIDKLIFHTLNLRVLNRTLNGRALYNQKTAENKCLQVQYTNLAMCNGLQKRQKEAEI